MRGDVQRAKKSSGRPLSCSLSVSVPSTFGRRTLRADSAVFTMIGASSMDPAA